MKIVFLLEERSMKVVLDKLLPEILPADYQFVTIPHEGKNDLRKSIPIKLKAWNEPDVKFVILHDQDAADCIQLKNDLLKVCETTGRDCLVRIVCHELDSWYWGDINAIEQAYGVNLDKLKSKRKFINPDDMVDPKKELKKYIPDHQQISGAKKISQYMHVMSNRSKSFQVFVSGVRGICNTDKG